MFVNTFLNVFLKFKYWGILDIEHLNLYVLRVSNFTNAAEKIRFSDDITWSEYLPETISVELYDKLLPNLYD